VRTRTTAKQVCRWRQWSKPERRPTRLRCYLQLLRRSVSQSNWKMIRCLKKCIRWLGVMRGSNISGLLVNHFVTFIIIVILWYKWQNRVCLSSRECLRDRCRDFKFSKHFACDILFIENIPFSEVEKISFDEAMSFVRMSVNLPAVKSGSICFWSPPAFDGSLSKNLVHSATCSSFVSRSTTSVAVAILSEQWLGGGRAVT